MEYVIKTTNGELYHHGVLGQKWGVRRYQNKDGSLTPAGRKHVNNNEVTKKEISETTKRKIVKGVIEVTTVSIAAFYLKSHPEEIIKITSMIKNTSIKDLSSKAVDNGMKYIKEYLKNAKNGIKEGVSEAMKEAPNKVAKTIVTGVIMNESKRALDRVIGEKESERIFKANDKKQIGKFWN